jgi:glycosyltransferase involved in cell wall biosynthesis
MVRALQYQPYFERSDRWSAEFTSRHSEAFARLQRDQRIRSRLLLRTLGPRLRSYNARWERRREAEIVERAQSVDLVSIIKSPGERLYRRLHGLSRTRVVIDINDGVWLPFYAWRGDLETTIAGVSGVICENEYIAGYARQFNRRVWIVPDAPQVERFDCLRDHVRRDPDRVILGWIGGSENVTSLFRILEPLEALAADFPQMHLRIVGADASQVPRFERVRWSCRPSYTQDDMVREVLSFDIGLFPLFHNEDARARGTLKIMVYMSGEAATVCENYGENPKLVADGINGMLASSHDEWYEKLAYLITHPDFRAKIARRGLQTIRERFTGERVFEQLLAVFDAAVA